MTQTGSLATQLGMDAALERVAETEWYSRAVAVLHALIAEGSIFDAETLRDRAGDPPKGSAAIGALLRNCPDIYVVGFRASTRPSSHGRRLFRYQRKETA